MKWGASTFTIISLHFVWWSLIAFAVLLSVNELQHTAERWSTVAKELCSAMGKHNLPSAALCVASLNNGDFWLANTLSNVWWLFVFLTHCMLFKVTQLCDYCTFTIVTICLCFISVVRQQPAFKFRKNFPTFRKALSVLLKAHFHYASCGAATVYKSKHSTFIRWLLRHRLPHKPRPVSCLHCAHPSPAKCNRQLENSDYSVLSFGCERTYAGRSQLHILAHYLDFYI